jgi:hypothetical protein
MVSNPAAKLAADHACRPGPDQPVTPAGRRCYFRVKTSLASIASPVGQPAAYSALAAGCSAAFHHGNLVSKESE